jgi:hypothetical protein
MKFQVTDIELDFGTDDDIKEHDGYSKNAIIEDIKSQLWEVNIDFELAKTLDYLKKPREFEKTLESILRVSVLEKALESIALTVFDENERFADDVLDSIREKLCDLIVYKTGVSVVEIEYKLVISDYTETRKKQDIDMQVVETTYAILNSPIMQAISNMND